MAAISEEHGGSSLRTASALRAIFPENRYTVRPGLPFIAADDSVPEPDLCVVDVSINQDTRHPRSCLLLVEVSHASLAYDRTVKAPLYAESAVADYWIINLVDRVLEVHRDPKQAADGTWSYASIQTFKHGESCAPLAATGNAINVSDLLPA